MTTVPDAAPPSTAPTADAVVEMRDISITFPGVTALDGDPATAVQRAA